MCGCVRYNDRKMEEQQGSTAESIEINEEELEQLLNNNLPQGHLWHPRAFDLPLPTSPHPLPLPRPFPSASTSTGAWPTAPSRATTREATTRAEAEARDSFVAAPPSGNVPTPVLVMPLESQEEAQGEEEMEDAEGRRLRRAARAAAQSGSSAPLVLEELRLKILASRVAKGEPDLPPEDVRPRQYQLTAAEKAKKERRKEQNRQAAMRCRQKKKNSEKEVTQKFSETSSTNRELKEQIANLTDYSSRLLAMLQAHAVLCSLRLKTEQQRKEQQSSQQEQCRVAATPGQHTPDVSLLSSLPQASPDFHVPVEVQQPHQPYQLATSAGLFSGPIPVLNLGDELSCLSSTPGRATTSSSHQYMPALLPSVSSFPDQPTSTPSTSSFPHRSTTMPSASISPHHPTTIMPPAFISPHQLNTTPSTSSFPNQPTIMPSAYISPHQPTTMLSDSSSSHPTALSSSASSSSYQYLLLPSTSSDISIARGARSSVTARAVASHSADRTVSSSNQHPASHAPISRSAFLHPNTLEICPPDHQHSRPRSVPSTFADSVNCTQTSTHRLLPQQPALKAISSSLSLCSDHLSHVPDASSLRPELDLPGYPFAGRKRSRDTCGDWLEYANPAKRVSQDSVTLRRSSTPSCTVTSLSASCQPRVEDQLQLWSSKTRDSNFLYDLAPITAPGIVITSSVSPDPFPTSPIRIPRSSPVSDLRLPDLPKCLGSSSFSAAPFLNDPTNFLHKDDPDHDGFCRNCQSQPDDDPQGARDRSEAPPSLLSASLLNDAASYLIAESCTNLSSTGLLDLLQDGLISSSQED